MARGVRVRGTASRVDTSGYNPAAEVCCNKSNALCKVSVEVMEGWNGGNGENGRGCWRREWSGGFGSRKGY